MHVLTHEMPLSSDLAAELSRFWEATFETSYTWLQGVLAGEERVHNRDTVYLIRDEDRLAGTCHLTIPTGCPQVGGLGEVATAPEYRHQGIATQLCTYARDEFHRQGGEALFLGTGNPAAARIYTRLGWRKLAGAHVMAHISSGDSPEAFLVDCFRDGGPVTVAPATPVARIPMIPLLMCPHDDMVLDANTGMISTRYTVQHSCMGLYPRYEALLQDTRGMWFGAHTEQGRLLGLSTAQFDAAGACRVDGFMHHDYPHVWENLIRAAIRWCITAGGSGCWAQVACEDEDKRSRFSALGFVEAGAGEAFDIADREVETIRLIQRSETSRSFPDS